MRPDKNNKSGFTLIELLVVSSMTVILAGVGISSYINQQRYSVLKNTAEEVVAYLNNARQRSISQEESSNWGVRFNNSQTETDSYALFVGAAYSSAREQRYFPSFLEFTNPLLNESTDIIFAKITGKTIDGLSKVATFKISGTEIYAMVTVTGEGLISYTISGSGDSGDAIIALPAAPDISCGGGNLYVILSWLKPNENGSSIISYRIYRGLSSGGETLLTSISAPGASPITYNDPNLTNGTNYYYQVSAINAIGQSSRSSEKMCTPSTFPAAPINLAANPDDRQCNLSWSPPLTDNGSPITGYKVYRGTASNPTALAQTLGNVLNYSDSSGLSNGTTYYYRLRAVNANGEGVDYSNEITCVPILLPPTNLTATYGDQQCSLSWTVSISLPANIAGYNLYRNTVSPPTTKIQELGNVVSYINTGLTNGTTYYYCLKTRNTIGNESVCSNIFSCQPKTVPGAPTGLTATGGNTSVTLNWTAPSATGGVPLTAYKLFRDMASPAVTLFKTLGIVTSYIDTEVTAGSTYYYRTKAVNSVGDSAFSNEATGSTFCTGKTNGTPCAETVPGSCGCTYSTTCACSASGTKTDTIYTCQSQACVSSDASSSCTCSRTCPGTLCRAAGTSAECDPAEYCDGAGSCPVNSYASSGTVCSPYYGCAGEDIHRYTCNGSGSCVSALFSDCINPAYPTYVCGTGEDVYTRTYGACTGSYPSSLQCPTTDTYLKTCGDYYECASSIRTYHDRACVPGSSTCSDSTSTTSCSCGCSGTACATVYSCSRCSDTLACHYADFNCCGSCDCTSPFNTTYTHNDSCGGCSSGQYCSGGSCATCPTPCTACSGGTACNTCASVKPYYCACSGVTVCGASYATCTSTTSAACE
jgi:prepilin-type N-terminal cleavage/methylation domain-containing protein